MGFIQGGGGGWGGGGGGGGGSVGSEILIYSGRCISADGTPYPTWFPIQTEHVDLVVGLCNLLVLL